MRRGILIALVLLPSVLAYWLYQNWKHESRAALRPSEGTSATTLGGQLSPFQGTAGRETFFIRREKVSPEPDAAEYPAWYYHLGEWERIEDEVIVAERVFALQNLPPKQNPSPNSEPVEMLLLNNDDSLQERLARLKGAAKTHTSLSAGHARFSGGATIDKANQIDFGRGVKLNVVTRKAGRGFTLSTEALGIQLDAGEVVELRLDMPFDFNHPSYRLRGSGLRLKKGLTRYHIKKLDSLQFNRYSKTEVASKKLRIESQGELIFEPSARQLEDMKVATGLLQSLRLDEGRFRVSGGAVLVFDSFHLKAQTLSGEVVAQRDADGRVRARRFRKLVAEGDVVVTSPDGEIRGGKAIISLDEQRLQVILVEDGPVTVRLGADFAQPGKKLGPATGRPKVLTSRSEGFVEIVVNRDPAGTLLGYRVTLHEKVTLDLDEGTAASIHAVGEHLVADIEMGPTNRVGAAADDQVARFQSAILEGDVRGKAKDLTFVGKTLDIVRHYNSDGLELDDVATLSGPAELRFELPADPKKNREAGDAALTASESIVLVRSASPFSPSRADAKGSTQFLVKRPGDDDLLLKGDQITLLVFADAEQRRKSGRHFEGLRVLGSADVSRGKNLRVLAESVVATVGGAVLDIEGATALAKVDYLDPQGRQQHIQAYSIRVDEERGKVTAKGDVTARVFMKGLVLTGQEKAEVKRAASAMDEPPDLAVPWDLRCRELEGTFGGGIGLSDSKAKRTLTLRDLRGKGSFELRNPNQSVTAREFFYDFVSGSGHAFGSPARISARRELAAFGGAPSRGLQDELEAETIRIHPDWSLLEGNCRAIYWVESTNRELGSSIKSGLGYEKLEVRCVREILLKSELAYFSGATVLERGDVTRGGMKIEAQRVVARLLPASQRGNRLVRIGHLEAYDRVRLRWRDLSGKGDLMDLDVPGRKLYLRAKDGGGNCRMTLKGHTMNNRALVYDMDRGHLRTYHVKGEISNVRRPGR
ncbi:MAG: hypothetical protein V3W41_16980 [Planctomycetota bacterium]